MSDWFKKTEYILYSYREWLIRIRILKTELDVDANRAITYHKANNRSKNLIDTTAEIALNKIESSKANELNQIIKNVSKIEFAVGIENKEHGIEGIGILTDKERELVLEKYFAREKKKDEVIYGQMGVSEKTYYRMKNDIIKKLARVWGIIENDRIMTES